jgi:CheY-like chemotaxis protein
MSDSPWPPIGDDQDQDQDQDPDPDPDHRHDFDAHSTEGTDGTYRSETAPCVLVAQADRALRDALRLVLEDSGYGVVEAADGVEAMDALNINTARFIVLLDVLLPGISGYETLLRAAKDPALRTRHAYCLLTWVHLTDARIGPRFNELITRLDGAILAVPFELETLLACVATLQARLLAREQAPRAQTQKTAQTSDRTADAAADNSQEDMEGEETA